MNRYGHETGNASDDDGWVDERREDEGGEEAFDSKHSNFEQRQLNDNDDIKSQVILGLNGSFSSGGLDARRSLSTLRRRPIRALSRTFLSALGGARKEVDDLSEFVLGDVNSRVQAVANALDELVGASGSLDIPDTNFLCKGHERQSASVETI